MRRILISAAVIGGVVVIGRALAPKLHARMLAACAGMFEQMPEDLPPKRMMTGIEEVRANTTRILELLDAPWFAPARREEVGSEPRVGHSSR